jgi:hypothetical protein
VSGEREKHSALPPLTSHSAVKNVKGATGDLLLLFKSKSKSPSNALTRHSAVKSQPSNGGSSPFVVFNSRMAGQGGGKAKAFSAHRSPAVR